MRFFGVRAGFLAFGQFDVVAKSHSFWQRCFGIGSWPMWFVHVCARFLALGQLNVRSQFRPHWFWRERPRFDARRINLQGIRDRFLASWQFDVVAQLFALRQFRFRVCYGPMRFVRVRCRIRSFGQLGVVA